MIGHRIYYKDRKTNEIWYYETIWPSISYDYLELYLKKNNKKFLYITNIEYGSKKETSCNWREYKDKCNQKTGESKEKMKIWELY